jgi:hypothetical protein
MAGTLGNLPAVHATEKDDRMLDKHNTTEQVISEIDDHLEDGKVETAHTKPGGFNLFLLSLHRVGGGIPAIYGNQSSVCPARLFPWRRTDSGAAGCHPGCAVAQFIWSLPDRHFDQVYAFCTACAYTGARVVF